MKKIIIFGNSGSGKSTLAKKLCDSEGLSHLDLDTLAWMPITPPERMPLAESQQKIVHFINTNKGWVIEGCYSDLIEIALPYSNELVFMDLPIKQCIENARNRPWEPHKYPSKQEQDKNLDMLIDWISQYSHRTDTFSKNSHLSLYEGYKGQKKMVTSNE